MIIRLLLILVTFALLPSGLLIGQAQHDSTESEVVTDPWPAGDILKPEALNKMISAKHKTKIMVIHTGPPALFTVEHIPGAVAVGQVGDPKGVETLKAQLKKIPKSREIVIYCGCCPWKHCPNIRPAYSITKQMGFKKVKVLDLPSTFKLDWTNKGFPVEK
ncbi:MAG: rhodanese-like domain-containing protein [Bacteroidota bacterium]